MSDPAAPQQAQLAPLVRFVGIVLEKDGPLGTPQMLARLEMMTSNRGPLVIEKVVDILAAEKTDRKLLGQRLASLKPVMASTLLDTLACGGWGTPGTPGFQDIQALIPLPQAGVPL